MNKHSTAVELSPEEVGFGKLPLVYLNGVQITGVVEGTMQLLYSVEHILSTSNNPVFNDFLRFVDKICVFSVFCCG